MIFGDKLPEMPIIPHKCSVWDYCILDNDYKLLFCIFCHRIVGYEKDGIRVLKPITFGEEHTDKGIQHEQNEYSEETLADSV